MTGSAVWWIKRDFRLHDNEAILTALEKNDHVLPVFIFEPEIIAAADFSAMHLHAQLNALTDLRKRLQQMGAGLMIAQGEVVTVIKQLWEQFSIQQIVSHEETGNWISFQRDLRLRQFCVKQQIDWLEIPQNGVIRRLSSRVARQAIIKERLFHKSCVAKPNHIPQSSQMQRLASQSKLPAINDYFTAEDTQLMQFDNMQCVSESAAKQCLASFLTQRAQGYSGGISSPNSAFRHGSRLSTHIAWGTLSMRHVFAEVAKRYQQIPLDDTLSKKQQQQWRRSLNAFRSRLHWHCHFIQRLESAPRMEFQALNRAYENVQYTNDSKLLLAWQQGMTGFPLVDACMRCLNAIGFLNFRMRAFVVSFAVFALHLDWRAIHPHLARVFYDYEPGIHLSQLQMQAGIVGINTVRVYSPTKQLIEQDPNCVFIKQWLPELRTFSSSDVQSYETIPLGCYPRPIVDFKMQSQWMKEQVFAIRKSQRGREQSKITLEKHGSRKRIRKRVVEPNPQIELF